MSKEKLVPCKRCGAIPKIVEIDGLYYVQCTGVSKKRITMQDGKKIVYSVKCDKWSPYEFLSTTPRGATENWNSFNSSRIVNYNDL